MPSVKDFEFEDVVKILEVWKFEMIGSKGSHFVYKDSQEHIVSVPYHRKKRITPGTMSNIIRCSGYTRQQWFSEKEKL